MTGALAPVLYWRLSAYYFAYFAFVGAYSSYFGLLLQSRGFSAPQIATLLSLMQVMRLFAPYLWGSLADRWGRCAPIIVLSSVGSWLCFALLFVWRDFGGMFVALALMAFFWCAALPLIESLTLGHLANAPERYGRIRLWGSIGFIVAVSLVGILLDFVALENLIWISAVLLAATVLAALMLPEGAPLHATEAVVDLRKLLCQRHVLALFAGCFFMSLAHGPLYVFYSIYLVDHEYSKTAVGVLWSLGVIAEIGIFLAMPRLLQRFSIRTLLLASFAAATLRFALIAWGVGSVVVLVAAQLLHALTFGVCHAASMAALHRWFPGQQQGRVQGLYGSASFGAGGLVGALGSGYLWPQIPHAWVYSLAALAAACGFALILAGLPKSAPDQH
jgi:PPP family 3-phenylpropionic acid transporter